MDMQRINQRIGWYPATNNPLSSDVGVVQGDQYTWLFDAGSSDEVLLALQTLPGPKQLVLSHFHQDHLANQPRLCAEQLYQGAHTLRYTHAGEVVQGSLTFRDGLEIHLLELPSSHAKGCIGMEVDGRWAFLGDATYCSMKDGRPAYNVSLLAEELRVLRSLRAAFFLLSHDKQFLRPREEVLAELSAIYAMRKPGEAYIFLT